MDGQADSKSMLKGGQAVKQMRQVSRLGSMYCHSDKKRRPEQSHSHSGTALLQVPLCSMEGTGAAAA